MTRNFPTFLGLVELVVYMAFDLVYARSLSTHKKKHPELEECAPRESPDLDTAKVLDSIAATAVEAYEHQREYLTGVPSTREYTTLDAIPADGASSTETFPPISMLHATVVICGVLAPIFTFLTLLLPALFAWTLFSLPAWLAYTFVAPGLCATALYAARVMMLLNLVEVSKTQWISMAWFRLDFMFIMSTVALLGVGDWLVAGCMLGVALYSAHRVIRMEKHLSRIQRDTQLVRDEVDVTRVLKPGSEDSKRAAGINNGYNAVVF